VKFDRLLEKVWTGYRQVGGQVDGLTTSLVITSTITCIKKTQMSLKCRVVLGQAAVAVLSDCHLVSANTANALWVVGWVFRGKDHQMSTLDFNSSKKTVLKSDGKFNNSHQWKEKKAVLFDVSELLVQYKATNILILKLICYSQCIRTSTRFDQFLCGCVYSVCVCVCVCVYGFCNVCECVCKGFVMCGCLCTCGCVYVWVL
jgi:hypothetical protein